MSKKNWVKIWVLFPWFGYVAIELKKTALVRSWAHKWTTFGPNIKSIAPKLRPGGCTPFAKSHSEKNEFKVFSTYV